MADAVEDDLRDRASPVDRLEARFIIDCLRQAMERPVLNLDIDAACIPNGRAASIGAAEKGRDALIACAAWPVAAIAARSPRVASTSSIGIGGGSTISRSGASPAIAHCARVSLPIAEGGRKQCQRDTGETGGAGKQERWPRPAPLQLLRQQQIIGFERLGRPQQPREWMRVHASRSLRAVSALSTLSLGPSAMILPWSSTISRSTMPSIALRWVETIRVWSGPIA